MAKKVDWIPIAIGLAVVGLFLGWWSLPTASTAPVGGGTTGGTSGGLLTSNPSLVFTITDGKTNSVVNEGIVELYDNTTGVFVQTATSSSGVATLSNLDPNTTYKYVLRPSLATSFYGFGGTVTTNSAGSKTMALSYKSQNSTAATVTGYNDDDLTTNTGTVANRNEIGQSDEKSFRIRIAPATSTNDNNYFGDGVTPMLIAVDYNSSAFTQVSMTENNVALGAGSPIYGHTVHDANQNSTAYFLSQTNIMNPAGHYDFYIKLKSSTTVDIGGGLNDTIYVTVYDGCYMQNSLTGTYSIYYRNPATGANVCSANAVKTLYYS